MGHAPTLTAEQLEALRAKSDADRAALRAQVQAWFDDINRNPVAAPDDAPRRVLLSAAPPTHRVVMSQDEMRALQAHFDRRNKAACARMATWFERLADDRNPLTGEPLTETTEGE